MITLALTSGLLSLLGFGLSDDDVQKTAETLTTDAPVDWNQWRGPVRDGTFTGPTWPEGFGDARLKLQWRVELGESYAGPIVTADRVFSVETRDETHEVVRALDRRTGHELWKIEWEGAMKVPFFAARNGSWVRSTPAFDGQRLYVAGMCDLLVCLDAKTGEVVWRVDFSEDQGTDLPAFGFVCSPLVVGDAVYVQAGGAFVKLNKETGKEIWRSLGDGGGMNGSAFASPVRVTLGGVPQLVVQSRTHLQGVSESEGAVLWRMQTPSFRGMNILTPIVFDEGIFTAAYGARARLLNVSRLEAGWNIEAGWQNSTQGYMTSPVIIDEHAYLFTRANRFTCIHLPTGETCWTSPPTGDSYWSLVRQGDRILALADSGRLYLLRANPESYQVLDQAGVSEQETWAHLAMSGREIFIRELTGLAAYSWQ